MTKVFIGSTSKDLQEYREAAIKTCLELDLFPVAMEFWEAMGVGATEGSKRKLEECDLYVGFFAFRYGYIEEGYNKSVTEIEFDYAGELGLDRLCLLADENHPWPPAAMDPEHFDKLAAFKTRINSLIRAQFTTVDSFRAELMRSLVKWRDENGISGTATGAAETAILAQTPGEIPHRPRKLIGRDDLAAEVHALLDDGQNVLLHGSGGMGKTALAATVAAQRIADGKGPVLWLRAGHAEANALFEALARPFEAQKAVAGKSGDAQIAALRTALAGSGIMLLVLDDAWDGKALARVLDGVPPEIPVLVTSRQNFPLEGASRDVGTLDPDKAVELLGYYADTVYAGDETAEALCKLLGCHTYGVQIAGCTLKAESGLTPGELHHRIKNAPHALEMPLDFAEEGRESVGALLEVSLDALDDEARAMFLAFGALFAPTATTELIVLFFAGTLEIDDSILEKARGQLPSEIEIDDNQLKQVLQQTILQNIDLALFDELLSTLVQRGLVEHIQADDKNIKSFRVHDLAYTYAHAQATPEHLGCALDACLAYTERYNEPNLPNFAVLLPLLDNFMNAAQWAMQAERFADAERFARNLFGGSEILDYGGFYTQAITLLALATNAAQKRGDQQAQSIHLGNLGIAYTHLGQYQQAIDYYQQALTIQHEINDQLGEANQLGNLGIVYLYQGQYQQAIDYYERALAIQREIGDIQGQANQLGNLGNAYTHIGKYAQAISYHQQALTIDRKLGNHRGEGTDLNNLGAIYADMGQYQQALDYQKQALRIRKKIGDRHGESITLVNLGNSCTALGKHQQAVHYYQQALSIQRENGDLYNEGNTARNLGTVFYRLGYYEQAINCYQQALSIHDQIDDRHGLGVDLSNIGVMFESFEDYDHALDCYQQARTIFNVLGLDHLVEQIDRNITRLRQAMSDDEDSDE